jgi:hypothetical protein
MVSEAFNLPADVFSDFHVKQFVGINYLGLFHSYRPSLRFWIYFDRRNIHS